jgi:hypothetical protein
MSGTLNISWSIPNALFDASLNAWSLYASGTASGIQVSRNGAVLQNTSNVQQIVYWNHNVWMLAGTTTPQATPGSGSFTDSFGNAWSLNASGNPIVNGNIDTASHAQLLELVNGTVWQEDTAGAWYSFTPTGTITSGAISWSAPVSSGPATSAPTWSYYSGDALGGNWIPASGDPATTASPQQTDVTDTVATIINTQGTSWQINSAGQVVHGGVSDSGTTGTVELLFWNSAVYRKTNANAWFSWNGSAWVSATKDPRTNSALGASPSGTFVSNSSWLIVDAAAATWTLVGSVGSFQIDRNGVSVQSAANVIELLYYQSAVYQATLVTIATITPGVGSITDIHGNVWTIDASGNVLENGTAVPGGDGTGALTYVPQTDTIYAQDQGTGNWFFWNGSTWVGPGAAPPSGSGLSWSFWNNGAWSSVSGDPRIFGGSNANNPTFSDEFTSLNMYNIYAPAAGQTWQPAEYYSPLNAGEAGGQFWILNPFNPATPINNIYTASNGILNLRVDNTPSQYLSAANNCPYLGAQLQTAITFSQTYGYFEVRMAIPPLPGSGAGFLLYCPNEGFANQIDVIQINTDQNSFQAGSFALWDAPSSQVVASFYTYNAVGVGAVDCSQFHQYGVLVTPTTTSFYIDRVVQGTWPTPSGYNVPLYPLIYMAGADPASFYGDITSPGSLPITGQFDYVKVWTAFPG